MTDLLVIMDMNNGFAKEGALYSPRTQELIAPITTFARDAKTKGWNIIGFSDCHEEGDAEFECFPPHCLQGTEECKFLAELTDYCDVVIPKYTTGGFFELISAQKEHGQLLELQSYDTIHLCGCCTDLCVFNFALISQKYLELSFHNGEMTHKPRIIIHKDLVDTYDMPGHNADEINNFFFSTQFAINGIEVI